MAVWRKGLVWSETEIVLADRVVTRVASPSGTETGEGRLGEHLVCGHVWVDAGCGRAALLQTGHEVRMGRHAPFSTSHVSLAYKPGL